MSDAVSAALVPVADTDPAALPSPAALSEWLTSVIEAGVVRMRSERGPVTQPEDVYPAVRAVSRADDLLAAFEAAISAARTRIRGVLEEELAEAVGEQNGIPNGSLSVPVDGQIVKIGAAYTNSYDIDTQQVAGAMVAALADEWAGAQAHDPEGFALAAIEQIIDPDTGILGKTSAKPTKVKAVAASLAARELDPLAAVARSAIGSPVRTFKGVTVERSTPKTAA